MDNTIDSATDTNKGRTPKRGDFSVCVNCAAVLRFQKNLQLRLSTLEEAKRFGSGEEVERYVSAVKQCIFIRNGQMN